jgi:4-amino-4-deoxy-L-arabinose transferase-like glycosyltransferase
MTNRHVLIVLVAAVLPAAVAALAWTESIRVRQPLREFLFGVTPRTTATVALAAVLVATAWSLASRASFARPLIIAVGLGRVRLGGILVHSPTITLALIVSLAGAFRFVLAGAYTVPLVLGDELIYGDLAKSIGRAGKPLLGGELHLGHSVLYPLVISPAYALASDGAEALHIVKAINCSFAVAAAIPIYFLARRVVTTGWSLTAAALTASMPWTAYAATMLTESLFVFGLSCFALLLTRMLERPTIGRQLAMLAAIGLLFLTRPQAVVLLGAVVAAVVLVEWGALRRALERYAPALLALGVVALAGALALAVGATLPGSAYAALGDHPEDVTGIPKWAVWNTGLLAGAVGTVAVVAAPIAVAELLRADKRRQERAAGATIVTVSCAILASVALLSASPFGLGILHERNLFYVIPLLLIALARWLAVGLPRPRRLATISALSVLALVATLPPDLVARTNNIDALTAQTFRALAQQLPDTPHRVLLIVPAIAGVLVFALARTPFLPLLAVMTTFVATIGATDLSATFPVERAGVLSWVDHRVPDGNEVTVLELEVSVDESLPCVENARFEEERLVVLTDHYNARVQGLVGVVETPAADAPPEKPQWGLRPDGTLLADGREVNGGWFAVDSRVQLAGGRIARFDLDTVPAYEGGASLTLWQADTPVRLVDRQPVYPPRADGRACSR